MKDTAHILQQLNVLQKAALLSGANTWQTRTIPAAELPPLWFADGPHGVRRQSGSADHLGINASEPATCFPTAATIAASWDLELAEQIGGALGREAAAQDVHVLLGPGLNIKRSPLGGRNFEYFSEDPELSGRLAAAYVRGIQSEGVAASPKHFAVNSQELRRMVNDSVVDERTLREIYLTAFEIVVRESSPWTIMSSYNLVNGEYAHENLHLLTDVLRNEWGFDGAVVSDWGGGNDPVAAVTAGGTIEMPSPGFDSARAIVAAYEEGRLSVADLDDRVSEVIELVRRTTGRPPARQIDVAAHRRLARRAAAESAVLLRNNDGILPLSPGTSVAIIGDFAFTPRFQGAGSSAVNARQVSTLIDALDDTDLTIVGSARGFRRDGDPDVELQRDAVRLAARADVAVLSLGLPEIAESEGADREHLRLPENQLALLRAIAANQPNVIVVLSAGGVVETPWAEQTTALLHAYLGGEAAAEAIADVLTGAAEPGGRLAETMPLSLADTPTAGRFPATGATAEYREGLFVGYRHYDTHGLDVAYPFGFGLGYTTFAYSDLQVSESSVTLTVANTGTRPGADVPQVYVRRLSTSALYRPARALAAFAKVQLESGESRRVTIELSDRTFRYFDTDRESWEVEGGTYEISVGHHSRAIELTAPVEVAGTVSSAPASPEGYLDSRFDPTTPITDADFAAVLGRAIPSAQWSSGALGYNDPISRISEARSRLARFAYGFLDRRQRAARERGKPDLNLLFMLNAPFRVISKMSGGLATRAVTDALLVAVNGRTFRGLGAAVAAFFSGRRAEKRSAAEFDLAGRTSGDAQRSSR